ncbi:MAG: ExeA family protein [Pseudonocardiaceae bacterium]
MIAQTADLLAKERDEAHVLDADQLEQLRMLSNADMDSDSPLAVVLLGQPSLRRIIRRGSYAALDQRIAVRYHLDPLPPNQVGDYIRHHLAVAGRSDALFADDAVQAIAHAARGLPRQIDNLAVAALIAGYTRRNTIIDMDCATAAIADHTAD